jgi:hypothetical protein
MEEVICLSIKKNHRFSNLPFQKYVPRLSRHIVLLWIKNAEIDANAIEFCVKKQTGGINVF